MSHNLKNKPILKVRFEDFWKDFDISNNFIINILEKYYEVNVVNQDKENPDVLFYSNFGINNYIWKNCIRIYITGEGDVPDFNMCDYAIGLADIYFCDRYLRSQLYAYPNERIIKINRELISFNDETAFNRPSFCCLISNTERNPIFFDFFNKLNKYKKIDSGGKWNNNIEKTIKSKYEFINKYKFTIAFENELIPGYVTEKIYDAFICHTIPIYWGSDYVKKDFKGRGMIVINEFPSLDEAIDFIKKVDGDYIEYTNILNKGNKEPLVTFEETCSSIGDFLFKSIEKGKRISLERGIFKRLFFRFEILQKIRSHPITKLAILIRKKLY